MKAPEKIYVVIDPVWDSMRVNYDRNDVNNIEYIRADAFIEKAQSFFRQSHYLFHLDGMDLYNFIEDFSKYMKG